MIDVVYAFGLVAFIITIGFFGNILFRRTRFPDVLLLIFIGLLLGPVFKIFPYESLLSLVPFITTLALIMVLFYGGMEMDIMDVVTKSSRAFVISMLYFIFVTIGVTFFAHQFFEMGWLQSMMFGPMIAGTSSIVIIPLISKLKAANTETGVLLSVESTMTDVVNIVFFFALLQAYLATAPSVQETLSIIAAEFSIGIILGVLIGIVWVRLIYWLHREEYAYMFTIALLFFVYFVSEQLLGSGVVAAFIFGLVCGNSSKMIHALKMRLDPRETSYFKQYLKRFQGEVSFLLRAFFFVFIGLLYRPIYTNFIFIIIASIVLVIINLVLRYLATWIATFKTAMAQHRRIITMMCGQGLAHAALSVIPLSYNMPNAYLYVVIVVNVIILTNIVTAVGAIIFRDESLGAVQEETTDNKNKRANKKTNNSKQTEQKSGDKKSSKK